MVLGDADGGLILLVGLEEPLVVELEDQVI